MRHLAMGLVVLLATCGLANAQEASVEALKKENEQLREYARKLEERVAKLQEEVDRSRPRQGARRARPPELRIPERAQPPQDPKEPKLRIVPVPPPTRTPELPKGFEYKPVPPQLPSPRGPGLGSGDSILPPLEYRERHGWQEQEFNGLRFWVVPLEPAK